MSQNSSENQPSQKSRLGLHYYPNDRNYRETDLKTWIPELKKLGMGWIVLHTPISHAIPELFIAGLISAGIEPILHVRTPVGSISSPEYRWLFETYAKWGVRYLVIFDRPNVRSSWPSTTWGQTDLVERFLDIYLPLAFQTLEAGLTPIFPPLEPGGDYWDTAFLRDALQGVFRRGQSKVLNNLALSAYASIFPLARPLTWGAGGPERWPGSRPYYTPADQQDHQGFHIFDWYTAIGQATTGKSMPLILLGVGDKKNISTQVAFRIADQDFSRRMITIAQLMSKTTDENTKPIQTISGEVDAVPANVIACNFVFLPSQDEALQVSPEKQPSEGLLSPVLGELFHHASAPTNSGNAKDIAQQSQKNLHIIEHYLLLPIYEWGIADWQFNVIQSFVLEYHPTIGFSLEEASHAKKVTVFSSPSNFSGQDLDALITAGCIVDCLDGDGTGIAPYFPTNKLE